jgi:hypothetical protein
MWKEEEEGLAEKERGIKKGNQSVNVVFCDSVANCVCLCRKIHTDVTSLSG